jgi:hypothetical protein
MTLTPRYIPGQALPDRQGSGWAPDTDRVTDASLITPPQITASKNHRIALTADINAGMPLEIIRKPLSPGQRCREWRSLHRVARWVSDSHGP